MLKFSIADAKAQFTRLLHEVEYDQQRFIMTKKNKDVAALISLEDLHLLKSLTDRWFLEHAVQKLDEINLSEALSLADVEKALGVEGREVSNPYAVKISCVLTSIIKEMPARITGQFLDLLNNLSVNPHLIQSYKIHGMQGLYRILFDTHYVVYRVEEKSSEVLVFSLAKP